MDRLSRTEGKDVVTVDDHGAIRRAHRDGMSIRQIARQLGHSRGTVRHALVHADPHPEPLTRNRSAPKLGPFQALIERILLDDETAPPKQRHTAAQIHRRLRDEQGYLGGYARVQRHVRKHRRRHEETFIPLGHLPGQRLEADFGHIHVDFPDGRELVPFLVTTWAYSNAPLVLALPFERAEAILEGMVATFEFFGAVPKEVWWDNPQTVAALILLGRQRQCHARHAALASHDVFEPRFRMPHRGNEKPDAESTVKAARKRFATPVPRVADLNELNTFFRNCREAERQRVVQSLLGPFVIKDRLAEDLAAASPLTRHRFDPRVIRPAVAVDKYQTVALDGCRHGVPRSFAFQTVGVKGYVDRVVITAQGQVVATHNRCSYKHTMVLDPIHYLATLGRKPAALDHAPVFRDWNLPACFAELRAELERSHGALSGSRRFARISRLLGEHPMRRVSRAIEECQREHIGSAQAVIQRTRSLATVEAATRGTAASTADVPAIPQVHVPRPDLGRYDQLLGGLAAEGPVSVFFA